MRRRNVVSNSSSLVEPVATGKWKDVVEICKSDPELISDRVTISGETALHMAISDEQTEIAKQLVDLLRYNTTHAIKALTAANERGNTPLHLAAAIGNEEICTYIETVDNWEDEGLIACRNRDGETPIFLAVLHGRERTFLALRRYMEGRHRPDYSLCRRNDGTTILHSAIARDYFGMAINIIKAYPDLVDAVNNDGFSPLHILATKPSSYRSGTTSITGFSSLLYDRFRVPKLSFFERPVNDSSQGADVEDPNRTNHVNHEELDSGCSLVYRTILKAIFFVSVPSLGLRLVERILVTKAKHTWSVEILDELLQRTSMYKTPDDDAVVSYLPRDDREGHKKNHEEILKKKENDEIVESSVESLPKPLLIAAKNGITEIVERYLARFPVAVYETDQAMKNIVLVAVEHRQPHIYELLLNLRTAKDTLFRQVDKDGNNVLHLAAKLGDEYRTRLNQDAALHMQREIKWFQYVRDSMPVETSVRLNSKGETVQEVFRATHEDLVKVSAEWFVHVSESCSFVAALVATVAFATATTIPGGLKQDVGTPALEKEPAFYVFAISSLVALCFSVTSTVLFLAILTSGFQIRDFHTSLPRKLLMGLTTLCISIIAMMVSFCASHFFILKDKLSYGAFGLYAAMALMPVIMTVLLISRFPHSVDLMWATFSNVPRVIPLPEKTDDVLFPDESAFLDNVVWRNLQMHLKP